MLVEGFGCWWVCWYLLNVVLLVCLYSKLQSDALREAISSIFADSGEKKRKFTETIELQIGLKNYDPQKDKRFSGSVKLPHIPRPKMKICMLGDASHVEEVNLISSFTSSLNHLLCPVTIVLVFSPVEEMFTSLYVACLLEICSMMCYKIYNKISMIGTLG